MRCMLMALAILLVALPAPAQDTQTFRTRVGTAGAMSGSEAFTITKTDAGYDVSAKATMKAGGSETTFALHETLNAEWAPQTYTVDMSGSTTATVNVERKGEFMSATLKTAAGSPARDFPTRRQMVLMDNLLAVPLQILLNLTAGKPGSVAVIVPFQLASVDGTLTGGGTSAGTLDGKPITATKLIFTVSGVQMELLFDPATTRLLRMFVPSQDAEIVREGFVPAAPAPVPEAPPPSGVTERQVSFTSGDGQVFPALLCLPKSAAPPLVVFVADSGPEDRDETIGPNKPFRDLAWGLAERGIASLRFDKRTHAFPATYKGTLDSESIDDAVAAVKYARTLKEVNGNKVFVLAHSLGGLAAPYVAQQVEVRGMILMAAPGRNMEKVIRDQVATINASLPPQKVQETLQQQDAVMARVRAGTATAAELNGQPPGAIRDMIVREPIAEWQKTKVPILVLKGGKDAQIFQADFDALQTLAAARPGSDAKLFPNLTHIFTVNDGAPDFRAIYQPGHVSAEVIDVIAGWVRKTS